MNWFDKWLLKRYNNIKESAEVPQLLSSAQSQDLDFEHTLRFQLTSARGGFIFTVNRYDERKDKTNRTVYVIDENEDIGKKVAEIVSIEMLRN